MMDKETYSKGDFSLTEWEDVNYCEHYFQKGEEQLNDYEVVDLLNELHEENQKCKEYNGILYANHTKTDRELLKQISELKKENEQLREELKIKTNEYERLVKLMEHIL